MICAHCETEFQYRGVDLALERGPVYRFCGERCERAWLIARVGFLTHALRTILVRAYGRGRELARLALRGTPPWLEGS